MSLAATLALAVIVATTGGVDFELGSVTVRSHDPWRVLLVAAALVAVRWWIGVRSPFSSFWGMPNDEKGDLTPILRVLLLTLVCLSGGLWLKFLLTSVGGADSYGYASAAQALLQGRLIADSPIAGTLTSANALDLASPLGWAPAPDRSGLVPTYPLGLPALMAAFTLIGGPHAIYLVAPIAAVAALYLVWLLARRSFDHTTALVAVTIAAWNPVFITYAKQPMSDVPATAWLLLAIVLALRTSNRAAAAAGVAAGLAFLTRPALILAAAVVAIVAARGQQPFKRGAVAAAFVGLAIAIQLALQLHLFGSPFATGYGSAGALFSWSSLLPNVGIYSRQFWVAFGPAWIALLLIGLVSTPRAAWMPPLALAAAVELPYMFYTPFDHWETLRFVLPGLLPLSTLLAAGITRVAAQFSNRILQNAAALMLVAGIAFQSERLLRHGSVWDIQSLEARYLLVAQWITINTPADSVVLAHQHSGSLRWYSRHDTLRWDLMSEANLETTIRDLEAKRRPVYAALEGTEVDQFNSRFASVLARMEVDPVGRVRNVSLYRLNK